MVVLNGPLTCVKSTPAQPQLLLFWVTNLDIALKVIGMNKLELNNMTSAQKLQAELAAVEAETAKSIKAAKDKMLALDLQIRKARAQELLQAGVEIQETLTKYNITIQEALSTEPPAPASGNGNLAKIRDYYKNNP